ncbi:MutS-like protein [Chitinophaga skermanii]|uniref:MutS-like protein n=1 Tax=Chitinophaga skermanii TaxID=331697 RepID=A0A327R2F6_9BACT|nr:DNA mismatch repair protein MutS [Chitinophaga skermanii]RAJ10801.1 MutS-like protein [Chitinophaga skermanii]
MELDKTTYLDLSIFNREEEFSLFHKLDFTTTAGGREYLRGLFSKPLQDTAAIKQRQEILQYLISKEDNWPQSITNGTIVVIEKYLEAAIPPISSASGLGLAVNSLMMKTFYAPDYGFIKFSFSQFVLLLKGFAEFIVHYNKPEAPTPLRLLLDRAKTLLNQQVFYDILVADQKGDLNFMQILGFDHQVRKRHTKVVWELTEIYTQLDAYYSMSKAVKTFQLNFPKFVETAEPHIVLSDLYHLILPQPIAYDITLDKQKPFLFLTGANMAGKTTFIKALGVAVFLAHLGMGVPAKNMELSFFHGILSNIQVTDNIFKGESYFFNEVQRIKNTVVKISDGKKWLILIDEMFKGTNVEDAKNCSLAVIRGLLRNSRCLYILSTHLYEIADELVAEPKITFKYFESEVKDDTLYFTYQLKDGIAKEKLGYLILKREKVLDLLEQLH